MGRKIKINIETDKLAATIHRAQSTCNDNIAGAINSSLSKAFRHLLETAPVYVQARWPQFIGFEHHWSPPPGTLRESCYKTKARSFGNGALFKSKIGARAPYASYNEKGVWRHHLSRKPVKGTHFITKAVYFVFRPDFKRKFEAAMRRTFGGFK